MNSDQNQVTTAQALSALTELENLISHPGLRGAAAARARAIRSYITRSDATILGALKQFSNQVRATYALVGEETATQIAARAEELNAEVGG